MHPKAVRYGETENPIAFFQLMGCHLSPFCIIYWYAGDPVHLLYWIFLLLTFELTLKNKHWPLRGNTCDPLLRLCICDVMNIIQICFCMSDIRFVLQGWGVCCRVHGSKGVTMAWFDVAEPRERLAPGVEWELESLKVVFINCYQCAGA